MRKNSPKKKSPRLQASIMRGVLALVLLGLLAVPIAVQAELKATSIAHAWDVDRNEFFWGQVLVDWGDGQWIPLLQEVYFDRLDRPPGDDDPPICKSRNDTTRWAGWIEYGLPYRDNDPAGAEGFQRPSRNWTLIDCDLDGDGYWDQDDLAVGPSVLEDERVQVLAECTVDGTYCKIMDDGVNWWQDKPDSCPVATSEHCDQELSTMLVISMDLDCDGEVDEDAAHLADAAGLCVYSEAQSPDYEPGDPQWTFPLPVRITDADGAKTLMLYPRIVTAVELASFSAEPQGSTVLVSWETATELDNLGFNLYRANAAGGERVRLNEWLIASQSLGSTVGSSYQFVDHSAKPGMAYEYWLEDIDLAGVAGMNGPVAVEMPRNRFMPCRPRPAPMPVDLDR